MTATYYLPGIRNLTADLTYHQDVAGSTSQVSDSDGQVMESYQYNAQGAPTNFFDANGGGNETSSYGVRHLWNGQQWDANLNLYDLRNRFYSPDMGRFLQTDPLGSDSNLYRYCGNNPINRADPAGLFSDEVPLNPEDAGETGQGLAAIQGGPLGEEDNAAVVAGMNLMEMGNNAAAQGYDSNYSAASGGANIGGGSDISSGSDISGGSGNGSMSGGGYYGSSGGGSGSAYGSGGTGQSNGGALTRGVDVSSMAGYRVPHSVAATVWNWLTGHQPFNDRQSDIPTLYGIASVTIKGFGLLTHEERIIGFASSETKAALAVQGGGYHGPLAIDENLTVGVASFANPRGGGLRPDVFGWQVVNGGRVYGPGGIPLTAGQADILKTLLSGEGPGPGGGLKYIIQQEGLTTTFIGVPH